MGKTVVPFDLAGLIPGRISKMNIKISDSIPRKVEKVGIFSIIDEFWPLQHLSNKKVIDTIKVDSETGIGIFIYDNL